MKPLILAIATAALLHASEIRMEQVGGKDIFRLTKVSGNGDFSVFVVQPHNPELDAQPMLGSTERHLTDLVFVPRFPLTPGIQLRAVWKPVSGKPITALFSLPKASIAPSTSVQQIFPTSNRLPENQLKLYIHFSAPMSKGDIYKHLRLLNAKGEEVKLAFLELDEELWDREGRRITLLFDPGRIKRGVLPLSEIGPALIPGDSYKLVIDAAWQDAQGRPLTGSFEKRFTVVPADRTSPDVSAWKLTASKSGVTLDFNEPLDQALLDRMILLRDASDREIPGAVKIDREETRWHFTPSSQFLAGDYRIEVDTALEDLAGNKIGKLFDVDVFDKIDTTLRTPKITLPFNIK